MRNLLNILFCFLLSCSIGNAQSILVNNQSVNVSSDISFPYWLDSTSTLAIDSNVVSISVLEFNITPTTNGNSLVFNQAKSVTSQETVPSGKTWKVESVLLDPSFVSTSNNNSGTTVVSGGGGTLRPVALSNESVSTMNLGAGLLYCDSLVEDGYDNWVVPTFEELSYVAGGGGIVPGVRTGNALYTRTPHPNYQYHYITLELNNGYRNILQNNGTFRCVRHAEVTVSSVGGGSSSGGSVNIASSGLTPIAISTESANFLNFNDAMLYCDSLSEDGYDDWILPTIDELTFISSGGLELPDSRTTNYLWSRSPSYSTLYSYNVYVLKFLEEDALQTLDHSSTYFYTPSHKTRCIRRGVITVSSGGGSSSGGSSTPSTLGNGMPTMISNKSDSIMSYISASFYCSNLIESGYDDWILPNYEQISYAIGGGCVFNDNRTGYSLWTRTPLTNGGGGSTSNVLTVRASYYNSNVGYNQYSFLENRVTDDIFVWSSCRCVR